ncbi:hypothetical protein DSO57_1024422 [Entomophthora muscae]|uniref:Uncharacterized protein n=1 Tax=Entomophthora muscae TaxID=34485 RepID=A0ACC2TDP9_9FUNG|nr:hypothetical protein DSO57_1024422 [Entomophthora muscae]
MSTFLSSTPQCHIRALFDEETVRVYQAYNSPIAVPAAQNNSFPSTFSVSRMTWVKPSFNWMAYRSGYSYKDSNQSHILAIDLHRKAFDEILEQAVLAKGSQKENEVVVQWVPERTLTLMPLGYRSIQIGIRGETAKKFQTGELIAKITDVTEIFQQVKKIVFEDKDIQKAANLVPEERVYPVSEKIKAALNI